MPSAARAGGFERRIVLNPGHMTWVENSRARGRAGSATGHTGNNLSCVAGGVDNVSDDVSDLLLGCRLGALGPGRWGGAAAAGGRGAAGLGRSLTARHRDHDIAPVLARDTH